MKDTKSIKIVKLILLAMLAIIVSMGDINCSWAFSKLHKLDPDTYGTEGIYWVVGVIVLLSAGYYIYREVKTLMKDDGLE